VSTNKLCVKGYSARISRVILIGNSAGTVFENDEFPINGHGPYVLSRVPDGNFMALYLDVGRQSKVEFSLEGNELTLAGGVDPTLYQTLFFDYTSGGIGQRFAQDEFEVATYGRGPYPLSHTPDRNFMALYLDIARESKALFTVEGSELFLGVGVNLADYQTLFFDYTY
jgi:hypothetical protein